MFGLGLVAATTVKKEAKETAREAGRYRDPRRDEFRLTFSELHDRLRKDRDEKVWGPPRMT